MKKLLFCIILIFLFIFLNRLVSPKYSTTLIEGSMTSAYYKEDYNHEVIILGDCEVYTNISPLVMYEADGITAYVRGNSEQLVYQSYYLLKETLNYETPKIVIYSVGALRNTEDKNEAYNRLMLDNMKWSKEKIDAIKVSMTDDETFLSYVFPILRYHDRIYELTDEDIDYLFEGKINTYNGFLINVGVQALDNLPTKKVLANYEFSDTSYEYLDKIVELCQDNDIELILIKAPSLYPYWYSEYEEQIEEYATTNNITYINFLEYVDEIGIDYSTDTYDGGLHLNLDGATKLSEYLSDYLKENYDLTDYREDDEVSKIYDKKLEEYYNAISEAYQN